METYISFCCTLIRGRDNSTGTDISEVSHQCNVIAKTVFNHMNRTLNSSRAAQLIEAFLSNMKVWQVLVAALYTFFNSSL